ncbi:hypothetical protein IJT93_01825 [bacterium]|nr:hypothetical protein [bacterium]
MNKFSAKLFLLATLSLGCLTIGTPAMAEKTVNVITEYGPYVYSIYEYPSYNTSYFFYENSYIETEIVNGKFWMIEAPKFNLHNTHTKECSSDALFGSTRVHDSTEYFDVKFYAPDGTLIGSKSNARVGDTYSIPRTGEKYEKLRVRIESRAVQNIDAKLMVWSPVNPVVAKPLGK